LFGQRVFKQTRKLRQQLLDTHNHLEDEVASRTFELQESGHRVRAIIDTSLDVFVAINSNGRLIDWNAAAHCARACAISKTWDLIALLFI